MLTLLNSTKFTLPYYLLNTLNNNVPTTHISHLTVYILIFFLKFKVIKLVAEITKKNIKVQSKFFDTFIMTFNTKKKVQ